MAYCRLTYKKLTSTDKRVKTRLVLKLDNKKLFYKEKRLSSLIFI